MSTETDLWRARQGVTRSLADLDGLGQRGNGCKNEQLRALLGDIARRKQGQRHRLLGWLGSHEPPPAPPWASVPTVLDEHAAGSAAGPGQAPASSVAEVGVSPAGVAITERREITPDLIVFRTARPPDFHFSAGQSVKVGLGGIRRSYSLVSAPHEPFLEFFVELAPGGRMSGKLRQMQVGDRLTLGQPNGGLHFEDNYSHHLMIATVTGINPFVSMLRHYLHESRQGHHFHLLHGASYQHEHGYRDELEQLAATHPDLITYVPTVSRPQEPANQGWSGAAGRVDTLVEDYLARGDLTPDNTQMYACGHAGMLDSITRQFQPQGFRLATESYD